MTKYTTALSAILATTALVVAAPAFAQDSLLDGWSGEASLSGSNTTGNTETTDLGLGLKLNKEGTTWSHEFRATADYGTVSDEKNKERYTVGYQVNREFTERLYGWGNADYYRDEFGAFEDGYFIGTGLGYALVEPAPLGWDVEGGVGYRSQLPVLGERTNEFAVRGASKITYDFNEAVSLYNNSEVIWAESDTHLWNEVGITANLAGNLAARASYRVDHHTDAPAGTEDTDTITRFGVVYTMD